MDINCNRATNLLLVVPKFGCVKSEFMIGEALGTSLHCHA